MPENALPNSWKRSKISREAVTSQGLVTFVNLQTMYLPILQERQYSKEFDKWKPAFSYKKIFKISCNQQLK